MKFVVAGNYAEYKDHIKEIGERRGRKEKSRRGGGVDKLIAAMEKQYGLTPSETRNLRNQEEVRIKGV